MQAAESPILFWTFMKSLSPLASLDGSDCWSVITQHASRHLSEGSQKLLPVSNCP